MGKHIIIQNTQNLRGTTCSFGSLNKVNIHCNKICHNILHPRLCLNQKVTRGQGQLKQDATLYPLAPTGNNSRGQAQLQNSLINSTSGTTVCGSTSPSAHDCLPHFLIRALPNELLAHNSQSQSLFIGNSTYITQQLWSTFPYFLLFHWTCSRFTASILPKSQNHISSPSWISFIFLTV